MPFLGQAAAFSIRFGLFDWGSARLQKNREHCPQLALVQGCFPGSGSPGQENEYRFLCGWLSLAELSLTDFGTTVRRSRVCSSNMPSDLDLCAPSAGVSLFTDQSWVTPRTCFRTLHKCASLEFPSPYHFSWPDSLHEIT